MGELDDAVVGAGHVALGAVVELEVGAVGIDGVEIHLVLARSVIPAGEEDASVRQHRGIAIMALIEFDLIGGGAVRADDLQVEDRLGRASSSAMNSGLPSLIRIASISLACGGADDAAVREGSAARHRSRYSGARVRRRIDHRRQVLVATVYSSMRQEGASSGSIFGVSGPRIANATLVPSGDTSTSLTS